MSRQVRWRALAVWLFLMGIGCGESAHAQPDAEKDPLSWDRKIQQVVRRYCFNCHSESDANGDVNLEQDQDIRQILDHRRTWETALTMIERGEMPPEDERQPTAEERENLIAFLHRTLEDIDCGQRVDPGPSNVRRLNRIEYDLTVEDLTGLKLGLAEDFPPDASAYGFDHLSDVLSMSPAQVEQYYSAAKKIVLHLVEQKTARPDLYERAFGGEASDADQERMQARAATERFATRAFRRPVDGDAVNQLMGIYDKSRQNQQSHETALGHVFCAVLISPRFLLRVEQNRPEAEDAYPVDGYELATRLSYFLWSRPPDERLLELAALESLTEDKTIESETRRMLADPRSIGLAENFFGQWLSLRDAQTHQPDREVFPEFDESLRGAILEEMQRFLGNMVQQDCPITDLIDCDYTFLNRTMARHYGIEGDFGDEFERVELNDRRRGGVITSAALTMLLADPTRTNVPRRGNFIAGRLLGTPLPPPPPNVPPLEQIAGDDESRTLRQLLELHRSKPECAGCHAKMDPLGFALENYDAIGRWREQDNGQPVEASGELASGRRFSGPVELKDVLLEQRQDFSKELIRNLLIYALGRGLQGSDECVVRDCLTTAEENDGRFASIVVQITQSVPFRYRRNPID